MTTRRIAVLALMIACPGGISLAEQAKDPVQNWAAPAYWTPPAARTVGRDATAQANPQDLPTEKLMFIGITPCRIIDTRPGYELPPPFGGPSFGDYESRTYNFSASTTCPGIPATAGAYSLNLHARTTTIPGFITVWPTGTTRPTASNFVSVPTENTAVAAIVPAGTSGQVDVYCNSAGNVWIDINGYYTSLLPFSGTTSSPSGLFTVQNNGSGAAIYGISSSGNGVNGLSGAGSGGSFSGYYGVSGLGSHAGGYFEGGNSGYAYIARGTYGIEAYGIDMGGYFEDTSASGYANVGNGDYGIRAYGNTAGGFFTDTNSGGDANVGYGTYKIYGKGSVSFVQNHPSDPGSVIVYAAPEGDEVATYTRGSARLVKGEARVPLGETFKWVTDPDIGLTAHITPRGDAVPLAVVSVSTEELVVRGPEGAPEGLVFDYMVFGLRIGFEETTVVQEKQQQSYIPAMTDHRQLLARRPDLVKYTALSRYVAARETLGIKEPLKLDRANALKAAIHEFDPAVDKVERPAPPQPAPPAVTPGQATAPEGVAVGRSTALRPHLSAESPGTSASTGVLPVTSDQDIQARSFSSPREQLATRVSVAGTVEPGDVLVVDREHPELFVRGERQADPAVVGVVVGDAGVALGARPSEGSSAQVALSGIARCKVDASLGAIAPGDLLVSSATPGHAMREASPLPGTVVGKALEGLVSGQGVIRILVMPR